MTLHFAYGSNMSRSGMASRCREAEAVGVAVLQDYRFIIMADGYASVEPARGQDVYGVLWRLSARDLSNLNAYENLQAGLYRRVMLPVLYERVTLNALVYVGRSGIEGRPRPGYMDTVIDSAREWDLPHDYVESLRRWAPARWQGPRPRDVGEL